MKSASKFIYLLFIFSSLLFAEVSQKKKSQSPKNVNHHSLFNINNISTFISNKGKCDLAPDFNSFFEFPKESGKSPIYQSGLVWGAKVNGEIRVGGSTYRQGLVPGAIKVDGTPEDPEDESNRVYRVIRNWNNDSIKDDLVRQGLTAAEVLFNYEKDWNEWPAEKGAPFEDVDNNGIYNPEIDIPGVPGADQTLWYVANDFDTTETKYIYGSNPFNLEIQVTVWGYNSKENLNNSFYKKYKIINKSQSNYEEMYLTYWRDTDLGDAGDDFTGVDTVLSLSYNYNARPFDGVYFENPPAVGYDFVQGPIVKGSSNDKAIFNSNIKHGYKNLSSSSHFYYINQDSIYVDPKLGKYEEGALRFYNIMKGTYPLTGTSFINPVTQKSTKFCLSGDPLTKSGWIDGILHRSGDRRQSMSSGPFNMAVGDTQEIVLSILGDFGNDNLDSFRRLKELDVIVQKAYDSLSIAQIISPAFPSPISTSIEEQEDHIILKWDKKNDIELFNKDGYKFQGYNIYQISDDLNSENQIKLLKTFDIIDGVTSIYENKYDYITNNHSNKIVQYGTDSGLEYQIDIKTDVINQTKLLNGKTYYFAVTAYTYNSNTDNNNSTESMLNLIEIKFIGDGGQYQFGDIIEATHINGYADAQVNVMIVDTDSLTGHEYELNFYEKEYYLDGGTWIPIEELDSTTQIYYTKLENLWNVTDITTGKIVLNDQNSFNYGDSYYEWSPNFHGIKISVEGTIDSPLDFKNYTVVRDNISTQYKHSHYNEPYAISSFHYSFMAQSARATDVFGYSTTAGEVFGLGETDPQKLTEDYELRFTGEYEDSPDVKGIHHVKEGTGSIATIYNARIMNGLGEHPMNPIPGLNELFAVRIPFEVWNIDENRQVNIVIVDRSQKADANPFYAWNPENRMYCEILNTPYSETVQNVVSDSSLASKLTWNLVFWKTEWQTDDIIRITYNNPIIPGNDKFTFSTSTTNLDDSEIPKEYYLHQNYPNPFNPTTIIEFTIPVVEANLASNNTKLIIYDILGRKIKTLVNKKLSAGKHEVTFDAGNLSSGVYFYRIEVGDFVQTKKMMLLK